jgi:hypothetical protein
VDLKPKKKPEKWLSFFYLRGLLELVLKGTNSPDHATRPRPHALAPQRCGSLPTTTMMASVTTGPRNRRQKPPRHALPHVPVTVPQPHLHSSCVDAAVCGCTSHRHRHGLKRCSPVSAATPLSDAPTSLRCACSRCPRTRMLQTRV